ncbi:hypothetical protein [Candidatus Lucifugimonas marina]|uniref:Glycosyltransferase family 1 protein n=1 Tax=Candidatus Lucifugimonas marina TaxID=3038979 RepID=A0AAJ5ZH56_9CHLR|nr:hypothetical protein [SAR202 cluster bacterium JH702]MDG0868227.1 hypothetical protein [SAR202 cluster bacterium JH639]WFG34871.1 hypothetical protein GKN94_03950 [SAR202 cluster bacterium JH545]WFG38822.1 hypothetical protein GKO48_04085 [SAR202 cluster bacterium JH1073]
MRIHVLTPGFTTSNGSAFLFPFVVHKNMLREAQLDVQFVNRNTPNIGECDVLAIDSKEFKDDWSTLGSGATLETISSYKSPNVKIVWFDTTDSSGTLQSQVFPLVDQYLKSQIIADKSRYTSKIYGGRIISDHYNSTHGITDEVADALDEPISPPDTEKIGVSWNSGLADYSTYGPWKISLFRRLGLRFLLRHPETLKSPSSKRTNDLSARFGSTYSRATVRYQREQIRKILSERLDTNKLNRRGYMKELSNSKVVLSPFGWGEITLKDFEVFLTGGMLLKPSMNQVSTWPNFYEQDVTYLSHDWDLTDIEERIDWAVSNEKSRIEIATAGQNRYIEHTSGPDAGELFVNHLSEVLSA